MYNVTFHTRSPLSVILGSVLSITLQQCYCHHLNAASKSARPLDFRDSRRASTRAPFYRPQRRRDRHAPDHPGLGLEQADRRGDQRGGGVHFGLLRGARLLPERPADCVATVAGARWTKVALTHL